MIDFATRLCLTCEPDKCGILVDCLVRLKQKQHTNNKKEVVSDMC